MKVFSRHSYAARFGPVLVGASCFGLSAFALAPMSGQAASGPTFSATYVSTTLGGGEPFVIYSHGSKDLVYSGHEGTTHIDKNYIATPNAYHLTSPRASCSS